MAKLRQTPSNIIVFESTALLATLKEFRGYMRPVECLYSMFDKVVIPDMVFYDLTAILPSSIPYMKKQFEEAARSPNPEASLEKIIDAYVRHSPRTVKPFVAHELRELLTFVAHHPDALIPTSIGESYCKSIAADHLLLGKTLPSDQREILEHYVPSRRDAMDLLGNKFLSDNLRVHVEELYQMGLMDKTEFKRRMNKIEPSEARVSRFIKIVDFVSYLTKRGQLDEQQAKDILATASSGQPYLTIKHFKDFEYLMPKKNNGEPYSIDDSAVTGRLNMAQYFHGGLIPPEELLPVAEWLNYKVSEKEITPINKTKIRDELHDQGFYEHNLTIGDIRKLVARYESDPRFDKLRDLLDLDVISAKYTERFDTQCNNPRRIMENQENPALPEFQTQSLEAKDVGQPYEKALTAAVIAKTISFAEYFAIVKESRALINPTGNSFQSRRQDILVEYDEKSPEKSIIKIRQKYFFTRTGFTHIAFSGRDGVDVTLPGNKTERYWKFSADELISRAQNISSSSQDHYKYHRVFDAMLYHAAECSGASLLHDAALHVLGAERLTQIEKDFSNRHYDRWREDEQQPAFASMLATLHVRRRITSSDLAEIATLQASERILSGTGQSSPANTTVWIANHDHALSQDDAGHIRLAPEIIRQKSEHKHAIDNLLKAVDSEAFAGAIQIVPTHQVLKAMAEAIRMDIPFKRDARGYGGGHNPSWETMVHTRRYRTEPGTKITL